MGGGGGGGKSGFPKFQVAQRSHLYTIHCILSTNSMLETMCPSLSTLAKVCLTIPVGTACSVHFCKNKKQKVSQQHNKSCLRKI